MAGYAPLDHRLGQRINVRGGGGKSTLARALARERGLACIELDALNWLRGWRERGDGDFRAEIESALAAAGDRWVVDGNYTRVGDLVLRDADTVIWLDLPWRVMFRRVLVRSVARAIDRRRICGDNVETWGQLLSRRSLWWYYVTHRRNLITRGERFLPLVPAGVPVIRIASARELDRFYELQGLVRG